MENMEEKREKKGKINSEKTWKIGKKRGKRYNKYGSKW